MRFQIKTTRNIVCNRFEADTKHKPLKKPRNRSLLYVRNQFLMAYFVLNKFLCLQIGNLGFDIKQKVID